MAMQHESNLEHDGYSERPIVRYKGAQSVAGDDRVIEEFPVALVFNGISHAVMMATPLDLEEFAVGFSLTEGIVKTPSDIFDLEVVMHPASAEIQLTVAQEVFLALKGRRRALAGRTGCGVCGIESIELLDLQPERIASPGCAPDVSAEAIERASAELFAHQTLTHATGGAHAAAWCTPEGAVAAAFEDVGRHNGLDKLIGHLARQRTDTQQGFAFLSSRASYELVRKAARVGIPLLATISAPTSLAIDIARQAGIRLLSFCRKDGFVDYTAAPANESAAPVLKLVREQAPSCSNSM
jgi:FdhD protein